MSVCDRKDVRWQMAWLYWLALSLGLFLLVFLPYTLVSTANRQLLESGLSLRVLLLYAAVLLMGWMSLRWVVMLCLAYERIFTPRKPPVSIADADLPFVSILVPAFHEADCIEDALRSLICLDYPHYEIVVVDDGSSDATYALAKPFEGRHVGALGTCDVRVYSKPNGGKWSAHNFAFRRARANFLLCIDADSRIEANALRLMIMHMSRPEVGAVSGQIRVRNRTSLLMFCQAFEYIMANGGMRLAQGALGSVMIVPGPIGLFRREAMERVYATFPVHSAHVLTEEERGPFSPETFAEDFNLSFAILALGYDITYEPHAVAHTKAPDSIAALINQRYRWNRGTMQVLSWYRQRARALGYARGRLDWWVRLTFLSDYYVFPLLYFCMLLLALLNLMMGVDLAVVASWVALSWLATLLSGSLYALVHRDSVLLVALIPLYDFYQGILLNSAWLISIYDQLRKAGMRW